MLLQTGIRPRIVAPAFFRYMVLTESSQIRPLGGSVLFLLFYYCSTAQSTSPWCHTCYNPRANIVCEQLRYSGRQRTLLFAGDAASATFYLSLIHV